MVVCSKRILEELSRPSVIFLMAKSWDEVSSRFFTHLVTLTSNSVGVAFVGRPGTSTDVMTRLIAHGAGLEQEALRHGALSEAEQEMLVSSVRSIAAMPGKFLFVEAHDPSNVLTELTVAIRDHGVQAVFLEAENHAAVGLAQEVTRQLTATTVVACRPGVAPPPGCHG